MRRPAAQPVELGCWRLAGRVDGIIPPTSWVNSRKFNKDDAVMSIDLV
jgi:hypothetical protein